MTKKYKFTSPSNPNNTNEENKLFNDLQEVLDKFEHHPYLRDKMWEIILKRERQFNKLYPSYTPSKYLYYRYFMYSYAYISSSLDNQIHYYSDVSSENKFSLLSQNNAKNILLLKELNNHFHNILMSMQQYGNDFASIEMKDNRYLIVFNKENLQDVHYIDYTNIADINTILTDMEDEQTCKYVFKLKYHNIEAKSNLFSIDQFNFFNMMTSASFFKDDKTSYYPAWHELLYMNNDALDYDGFIKTWFSDRSNNNITLMFMNEEYGKKLTKMVSILRKIFKNTEIFLDNSKMYKLSAFYMKIETWMLYKDIKWHLKVFDGWAKDINENDISITSNSASLQQWCKLYGNISRDEFYTFIKKRLIYVFNIYTEIRNVVKQQLLEYLNKIRSNDKNKDLTQETIENILNNNNILYKFKNAKSIRLTGAVSTSHMLSQNEIDEYLNTVIGSDEEFINTLKEFGDLIAGNDLNVIITEEEYNDIINKKSDLNNNFSNFYKPWILKKK